MFRRKEEDSLFDSSTDTGAPREASAEQHSTPATQTYGNAPVPPSQAATRFTPESRANSFRASAAPLPSDIGRNRMPDAKAGSAAANTSTDKSGKSRRVLTVGNDILLKGEIATCDRLVIEGKVDATLNDVHTVEIAETGSFKGSAQIEDAEISGLFEGDLTVRGRLVIYATGRVRGKISYGEIEIERGGEISGEIKIGGAQQAGARSSSQRTKEAAAA